MNELDLPDEFVTNISSIIVNEDVKIFNKETDIYEIISTLLEKHQSENPFFVVNLGNIVRQYNKWITYLPRVKPFYAVKCNPDDVILTLLAKLGCSFDCASKNEIAKIINLGVSPDDIIFANPCKLSSQIKFSRAHDVDLLTFDSENELYKTKLYHPEAKLLLRIKTDDRNSVCKFSCKFGADMDDVIEMLKVAKQLKLNVIGVSFHVGSNCHDVNTYANSINDAKKVFDLAKDIGYDLSLLDLGGGYPATDTDIIAFKDIANVINTTLDTFIIDYPELEIIAEPGRFFVGSSHTLVLNIINKKININKETGEKQITYYCNDGVYSSLNNIVMDHFVISENNTFPFSERNEKKYKCSIYGPTCDSADKLTDSISLPDLCIGEYIFIDEVGAYIRMWVPNSPNVDGFNGFSYTESKYVLN